MDHRDELHRRLARAHQEGIEARHNRVPERANPYTQGKRFDDNILEASFWTQGWREADQAAQGAAS